MREFSDYDDINKEMYELPTEQKLGIVVRTYLLRFITFLVVSFLSIIPIFLIILALSIIPNLTSNFSLLIASVILILTAIIFPLVSIKRIRDRNTIANDDGHTRLASLIQSEFLRIQTQTDELSTINMLQEYNIEQIRARLLDLDADKNDIGDLETGNEQQQNASNSE